MSRRIKHEGHQMLSLPDMGHLMNQEQLGLILNAKGPVTVVFLLSTDSSCPYRVDFCGATWILGLFNLSFSSIL